MTRGLPVNGPALPVHRIPLPSGACYSLIRKSEYNGAWPCRASWDVDGWQCGYGTHGPDVNEGTVWTQEEAEARMGQFVARVIVPEIEHDVTVPLTQGQMDGLADWYYNEPYREVRKSTLLELVNAGRYDLAVEQFPRWDFVNGKPSAGLLARREAEQKLWTSA